MSVESSDSEKGPKTYLCGCADALLDPLRPVLVRLVDERQRLDVWRNKNIRSTRIVQRQLGEKTRTGVEVLGQQVVVVLADRVQEATVPIE